MKTVEEYMEAVRRDGLALEYVPEGQRTVELCLEAVRQARGLGAVPCA
jgi:hypothetical protein